MHSSGIHSPSRITKCSFIVHIDLVNSWSLPLWIANANPLGPEIMFVGAMEMQQQPSLSIMTVMSQNSTVPFLVLKFSWNRCWVYVLVSCYYFLHLFVNMVMDRKNTFSVACNIVYRKWIKHIQGRKVPEISTLGYLKGI